MPAYSISLPPISNTPSSTSNADLYTADADVSVLVGCCNIGTGAILVRIGIDPVAIALFWKVFDFSIAVGDSLPDLGPWALQSGDKITVRTSVANDAVFSLTGYKSN